MSYQQGGYINQQGSYIDPQASYIKQEIGREYPQEYFPNMTDSKTGNAPPPFKRYKKDESADPTNPNPSLVIHVRNLSSKATEADLLEALSHFGHIAYATVMPNRHMALVEFETLDGARACVVYAQSNQIFVAGQPALFNYSTSQAIQRIGLESEVPNHILVVTIYNVQYPITVEIIHQIAKPHGDVKRIAIVKPKGILQALVEFESVDAARRAKYAMNGADIYSGCCTLKCEFAKVDRVQVKKNDSESWDFTLPPGEQPGGYVSSRKALLSTDQVPQPFGNPVGGQSRGYGYDPNPSPFINGIQPPSRGSFLGSTYEQDFTPAYKTGYGSATTDYRGAPQENLVVMVYGLDHDNFNPEKLFNVLCCYGNPVKIKFMKSKTDTAMVEMGNGNEVGQVCKYLTNAPCFGTAFTLRPSKSETLKEPPQPFDMPDGTPSFKDFRIGNTSRLLRFSTPENAARNRLTYPSESLHWYNAPPSMTEEKLKEIFENGGAPITGTVTIFKSKSERSSSGICEFESTEKAVEAMMLVNHTPIESQDSQYPYILKLSFYGTGRDDDRRPPGGDRRQGGGGGRFRDNRDRDNQY